ncbi:OmpA family protein [Nevskia sp.]|uniref:OmpA family protein n=1 Tax=Nevskia sp. TaxID=1929292 RepID=UPI0025E3D45B|nr:OmpA family protein [Nevskia sp.]
MLKTLAALAVIGTTGAALADDEPVVRDRLVYTSNDYISVVGGLAIPDSGRGTDDLGGTATFIFGNQIHENIAVEGRFTAAILETGRGNGTDFYQYSGGVDLSFSPYDRRDEHALTPFALIGILTTADDVTPDNRDDGSVGGNVGLGFVTKPLIHNLRLRAEGRYTYSSFESGYHDFSIGIGFELPLGRVREKLTVVPSKLETRVVEIVKTVPRTVVDSDGDTIEDAMDQCGSTPKGLKVDATGCMLPGQLLELRGVTFEANEAKLRPNAQSVLDVIARGMVSQPSLKVEIAGHSALTGSATENLELSQARADSVRAYLIEKGVSESQLTAVGYGKKQPKVKTERNDDDRTLNRRVEFRVVSR